MAKKDTASLWHRVKKAAQLLTVLPYISRRAKNESSGGGGGIPPYLLSLPPHLPSSCLSPLPLSWQHGSLLLHLPSLSQWYLCHIFHVCLVLSLY